MARKFFKRATAVALSLVMCLTLLPGAAFAADENSAGAAAGDHTHYQIGWDCEAKQRSICTQKVHTHGDGKCAMGAPELICGKTEHKHSGTGCGGSDQCGQEAHQHEEECYKVAECSLLEHTHASECYKVEWTCVKPENPCTENENCTASTHRRGCPRYVAREECSACIWMGTVRPEPATCEEPGRNVQICAICGNDITTAALTIVSEALGHDFENGTEYTARGDEGHVVKCSRCEKTSDVQAHNFGDWYPVVGSDEIVRECSDCGYKETRTVDPEPTESVDPEPTESVDPEPTESVDPDPTDPVNPNPGPTDPVGPVGPGGTEIEDPEVPLGGGDDIEIDDPDVPLAGLMTRAEFVNYLYVQEGSPEAAAPTFADVAGDHEYAAAIGWAQANGVAVGIGNNEFAPDDLVIVEEAELFLERYTRLQDLEEIELAALADKEPDDILDNADEVLTEFFAKLEEARNEED